MKKKYQVVVCGTRYGHVYISAFIKANPNFRLAGIMGKGSKRSQQYAKQFGVPFYHDVSELPSDINIACVVVKSKVLGGPGTEIALELLERGIHVIQEHPVHPGELYKCFEQAKKSNVCYHVNSQYINVEAVKIFIRYIQKAITKEKPLFIEATTALIYSTLDIIGVALGDITPFCFGDPFEPDSQMKKLNRTGFFAFKCLEGIIGGIPLTIRLQDFQDPNDLDNNFLTMCKICVGMQSGNLTLMDVYGPVIWCSAYSVPEYIKKVDTPSFNERKMVFSGYRKPSFVSFSESTSPGLNVIVNSHWPDAIWVALERLIMEIETKNRPKMQTEQYLINLSKSWIEIMRRFGNPQQIEMSSSPKSYPDPLEFRNTIFSNSK